MAGQCQRRGGTNAAAAIARSGARIVRSARLKRPGAQTGGGLVVAQRRLASFRRKSLRQLAVLSPKPATAESAGNGQRRQRDGHGRVGLEEMVLDTGKPAGARS